MIAPGTADKQGTQDSSRRLALGPPTWQCPPDTTALQFGPAHPRPYSFYDEGSLNLRDCADNHDSCSAERILSVNGLALRMELDSKAIQLVEHLKEMSGTTCESITRPNQHGIEAAGAPAADRKGDCRAR